MGRRLEQKGVPEGAPGESLPPRRCRYGALAAVRRSALASRALRWLRLRSAAASCRLAAASAAAWRRSARVDGLMTGGAAGGSTVVVGCR